MSRRNDDPTGTELLILVALIVLLFAALHACTANERADCDARGGTWLWHESACVDGPDGGL